MEILVTGASGFIGMNLVPKLLEAGHRVTGVDLLGHFIPMHERFRFVSGDLFDLKFVEELMTPAYDSVIHLAGKGGVQGSFVAPDIYVAANVTTTANLLANLHGNARFILASSSSVYGNSVGIQRESDALRIPLSPYAATKIAAEAMVRAYSLSRGIHAVILRLFTVFGPHNRKDMAFYQFADSLMKMKDIDVYGGEFLSRDFTPVEDTCESIMRAATFPFIESEFKCLTINVGLGVSRSIVDVVPLLAGKLGCACAVRNVPIRSGDALCTLASQLVAREVLDWKPSGLAFDRGVDRFVDWFKSLPRE